MAYDEKWLGGKIMTAIGIIGIIVALVLFLVLVYKGVSSFIVAPVCAVVVAVTNAMSPVTTFYTFAQGLGDMIVQLFAIVFLGAVLGKLYTDTKAAASIAKTLTVTFIAKRKGKTQVRIAILIMMIIAGLMTMGGIDGFVLTFTTFPIAMIIAEMVKIPRRFVPAMLMLNCAFMACPGAPQIDNIAMVGALQGEGYDVSATAAAIPGLIGVIIVIVLGYITLTQMIIKAQERGEVFDAAGIEMTDVMSDDTKLPNFFVALIPLVLVFVLYTIVGLDVAVALTAGNLAVLILMGRYIEKKDGSRLKGIISSLNMGADSYPNALTTVATPSGLATVVTSTAAFGAIVGALSTLNLHPVLLAFLVICVVVALTSAPPVALYVGLPVVVGICRAKGLDFNVAAVGRVAALAATTFETLPVNGMCVLTIHLARSSYKESYLPMFLNTLVYTLIASIVVALICIACPGLAF